MSISRAATRGTCLPGVMRTGVFGPEEDTGDGKGGGYGRDGGGVRHRQEDSCWGINVAK